MIDSTTDAQRIEALEKRADIQDKLIANLFGQLGSLDAIILGHYSAGVKMLASMTGTQVAVMQMYQHYERGTDIDERLGLSKGSARQLKRRIVGKMDQTDTNKLPAYAEALERAVPDALYMSVTGLPKHWFEKYGDCSIEDDPYANIYRVKERESGAKDE